LSHAADSFAGVISGTGGLTLTAGTETLSGGNLYTGATTIGSGAALELSATGSVASSSGVTLANGASLILDSTTSTHFSPTISFSGATGTVVIASTASTYSLTVQGSSWTDHNQIIDFTGLSFSGAILNEIDTSNYTLTSGANKVTLTVSGGASGIIVLANDGNGHAELYDPPVTHNAETMTIADAASLPLCGIIDNTGTIGLNSAGDPTELEILAPGATLQGGGHVTLSDNSGNTVYGANADATLTNVDNTISGSGQVGAGQMTLINEATIIADGTNALVIDTGTNVVSNSGTLEATGSGGLIIHSDVANFGLLWANGGDITNEGAVTGNGSADIESQASLEFGAASSANTIFGQGASGKLILDHAENFTGAVSGFRAGDLIDLANITFSTTETINYAANQNGIGGILTISDGTTTANIALVGQYNAAEFQVANDGHGGTLVFDLPGGVPAQNAIASLGVTTIANTSANQTLIGTGSNDTFVFTPAFGNATITNFQPTTDVVQIDHSVVANVEAILAAMHDDGHGNISIGLDAHNSITINNVTVAQLQAHQSDFHIS
jgi:hypothetical protein